MPLPNRHEKFSGFSKIFHESLRHRDVVRAKDGHFERIKLHGRELIIGTGKFSGVAFAHASELVFLNGRVQRYLDALRTKKISPQGYVFHKMSNMPKLQAREYFLEPSIREIQIKDGKLKPALAKAFTEFKKDWEGITNQSIDAQEVICLGERNGAFVFTVVGLSDYYKTNRKTKKPSSSKKGSVKQKGLISTTEIRSIMGGSIPVQVAIQILRPVNETSQGRKYSLTDFLDIIKSGRIEDILLERACNPQVVARWTVKKTEILKEFLDMHRKN
ncbi:MAG: hypothetical protein HOE11_00025 [Candidatus Diapherotrites archaeon]|jgi:hypothetical protein|nr:hypothetical protein [Candidatus Diapherotrites archaeon]MBT4597196.1 hypothetical protein [Candidatus Diapherotrites archaeon]